MAEIRLVRAFFLKILLAFTDGIEKIAKNTVIHQNLVALHVCAKFSDECHKS
jgi:hypothetical protein